MNFFKTLLPTWTLLCIPCLGDSRKRLCSDIRMEDQNFIDFAVLTKNTFLSNNRKGLFQTKCSNKKCSSYASDFVSSYLVRYVACMHIIERVRLPVSKLMLFQAEESQKQRSELSTYMSAPLTQNLTCTL